MDTKIKIFLLDGGTARGKTFVYVNHIASSTDSFVIGTQLHDLSVSVKNRLIADGASEAEILIISSKTHKNCTKAFKAALKSKKHRIVLVDQSVAMRRYEGAENFHLILDEAPKIDTVVLLKAADALMQKAFAALFQGAIGLNAKYYELECTPAVTHAIQQIQSDYRKNDADAAFTYAKRFIDLTYKITDDKCFRTIVNADDLRKWREGIVDEKSRDRKKLVEKVSFHPTLKASALGLYRSATIACAHATEMEFYDHWIAEAEFEAHPLCDNLRADISDVKGHLIHVHFISETHGSRYELDKLDGGYQHMLDHFAAAYQRDFQGSELLFCMSKSRDGEAPFVFPLERGKDDPFTSGKPAIRLTSSARGVDEFKHIHCVAILSPLNPTTPEFKFKRDCHGMMPDKFRNSRNLEQVYQFASRISVRDYDCDKPIHIFVLDRSIAEGLCEYFGCREPTFFDIGIDEMAVEKVKAAPKTGSQRQHKYLENQKAIKNDIDNTEQYEGFKVIQWARRGSDKMAQETMSWFDIAAGLEADSLDYAPKSKTSAKVFREGDLTDVKTHTLRGNIKSTKLLFFDIDNALLEPKKLSDVLAANGWSHFIYHSFSSTDSEMHIRVVLGLDMAVNADNYTRIIKLLEQDIIAAFGTYQRTVKGEIKEVSFFEIDQSKMTINCNFHNPCVPMNGVMPFIKRTVMKDGAFAPKLLCVRDFLARHQVVQPHRVYEDDAAPTTKPVQVDIEGIVATHEVPAGQPGGHRAFFAFGDELVRKVGLPFQEVDWHLRANIHRFGNPENRSVEGVMESLRRYHGARVAARELA